MTTHLLERPTRRAAESAGTIGPNAVIQTVNALTELRGPGLCAQLLELGVDRLLLGVGVVGAGRRLREGHGRHEQGRAQREAHPAEPGAGLARGRHTGGRAFQTRR